MYLSSFFEKSNELLANQTDSMQNTAAQAMVKVSTLEQQNVSSYLNVVLFSSVFIVIFL